MKNKKIWLGMLALALAFGMTVVGCSNGSGDDDYDPNGGNPNGGNPNGGNPNGGNPNGGGNSSDITLVVKNEWQRNILSVFVVKKGDIFSTDPLYSKTDLNIATGQAEAFSVDPKGNSGITIMVRFPYYTSGDFIGSDNFDLDITPGKKYLVRLTSGRILAVTEQQGNEITYTAVANDTTATTAIDLTFSSPVSGLTAGDISVNLGTSEKGSLTGSGTSWSLAVNPERTKDVRLTVNKSGVEILTKTVSLYRISYTAVPNSTTNTTAINFTFSSPVSGLTANDISLGGAGSVIQGAFTGSGISWSLGVTVTRSGQVTVVIDKAGVENISRTVLVNSVSNLWTAVTNSTFGVFSIESVAWGNDKFVAVGGDSQAAYSADGITWTAVTGNAFSSSGTISGVTYGNDKFVAVGERGKMAYSADGINWTTTNSSIASNIQSIAWGNDKFVAVGYSGNMAYSADGINWTSVTNSTFGDTTINDITWGNDKFVAVGSMGSSGSGKMAYSADGITWTAITPFYISFNGVSWGNDKFVVVESGGRMAYSADGISWTLVEDSKFGSSTINDITWGNDQFIAVGNDGKMSFSSDGIIWYGMDNVFGSSKINDIVWGNDRFVAVGSSFIAYWNNN